MMNVTKMTFKVTWSEPKKFAAGNFNVAFDGVYLIGYRDTATDKRHVVYVGQGDIGTRLADHLRNNASVKRRIGQAGRVGYYRYATCADEDIRLDIELGLYRKHGGSVLSNEIEPCGSGRYGQIEVSEEFQ
jgi:hypothetical protein